MKKILLVLACCFAACSVSAQPGIAEMQQAQQDLKFTFFSAFDLSLIVAGLFGIIGGLRIYKNAQTGTDKFSADVAAWFFAAIFMTLAGVFLRAIFGI
ncbi:protein of unknown function [Mucilaginibacter gossypiicola]|uniref:Uncharacterized protein n=1 Tax=Mucilaginibacter gossypiicola TaxID=551995 RepID=A0A1H8D5U2_9SPHI|nr:DUF4134 family protein [Mucilaginibacter gossypiicola]SEN01827.1 protein of unknown function [Mucilaginibacter gossypiicola]